MSWLLCDHYHHQSWPATHYHRDRLHPAEAPRQRRRVGDLSHGEYGDCPLCSWRAAHRGGSPPGPARAHGGVAAHACLTRRRSTWPGSTGRGHHDQWTTTDTPPGPEAREAGTWYP